MKVLLADNSPLFQRGLKRFIDQLGYSVKVASNGKEGMEIFLREGEVFDVILSDLDMPILNGIEFRHEIAKLSIPCPPFILYTGCQDFIKNPYYTECFDAVLHKLDEIDLLQAYILVIGHQANKKNGTKLNKKPHLYLL